MLKRLTALVFILIVAGGVLAGTPLHACPPGCGTGGVDEMDAMECCRKAQEPPDAPGALAAKLCCADCAQPAPVGTAGSEARRVPETYSAQQHPAALPSRDLAPKATPDLYSLYLTPSSSKPAYILHLALLI
jgi:hypothetical protein